MTRISRHAATRMQQRGCRADVVAFVMQHGTQVGDGVLFTAHDCEAIEREARYLLTMVGKVRGIYLPIVDGTVKTVFRASRRQQRRLV